MKALAVVMSLGVLGGVGAAITGCGAQPVTVTTSPPASSPSSAPAPRTSWRQASDLGKHPGRVTPG